jgi:signal transduction histidine kinase/DNA-binding response OmpR family regulator
MTRLMTPLMVEAEQDVVLVRQRARQLAELLGFQVQDQTRVATAVSEITRNAFRYARGGRVEFRLEGSTAPQVLEIEISDRGSGIPHLADILTSEYRSQTGLGIGIIGARRLMDQFDIRSTPEGTSVVLKKVLPRGAPLVTVARRAVITDALARVRPTSAMEEVQRQNQELLQALDELRRRQDELRHLNRELEDTNRGVVALYAELDEKADHLRRADELKSRFLSNMSHEFRTPLNAIAALSHVLLDRVDGELTPEQEKQVRFIRKASQDLTELVNDLLDLAKVEAGKISVRPVEFEVDGLFRALRGMLRPLLVSESVRLTFEAEDSLPTLYTDEGKVSQILRNFISNALKYTERGEIRVTATAHMDEGTIAFAVSDTGIGIASDDQELIFEEFTQLEHRLQQRVKGTGLGLPLAKKLTELLGGRITLTSAVGVGSTFTAIVPVVCNAAGHLISTVTPQSERDATRVPVLVVEDDPSAIAVYEAYLKGSGFQLIAARNLREARRLLETIRPQAIILDLLLDGEDAWTFLAQLKRSDATADMPVLVVSTVDDARKGLGLKADAYGVKPVERGWLLGHLRRLVGSARTPIALVIDDDATSRYVLKRMLATIPCVVAEAESGAQGLEHVRREHPDVIFLDLMLPDMGGSEVLATLRADPVTAGIPVVVVTGKVLDEPERSALLRDAVAILSKEHRSREEAMDALRAAWQQARAWTVA